MSKLMKSAILLCTGFILVNNVGCRFSEKRKITTARISSLPDVPRFEQLAARIISAPSNVNQLIVSSQVSNSPGLNYAFALQANNTTTRNIGLLRAGHTLNIQTEAILADGRRVSCTTQTSPLPRGSNRIGEQFSARCDSRDVSFEINRTNAEMRTIGLFSTLQALRHGASVTLRNSNNLDDALEMTIRGSSVFIANKQSLGEKILETKATSSDIDAFLSNQKPLSLPCTTPLCPVEDGLVNVSINEDGDLRVDLQPTEAAHTTQQTFVRLGNEALRVSSYNVENFWDDVPDNSTPYDDFSTAHSDWYSGQFAIKKAERIKTALLAAGLPDVVGLQEIESANNQSRSLELLKQVMAPLGYHYYALGMQGSDNPTAVTTAFMSKYPLLENNRLDFQFAPGELPDDKKEDFLSASRDPQRVTVGLPEGVSLTLFNSHWKSKRDKSPWGDLMRQQTGRLMREHLDALQSRTAQPVRALIMGDFNADFREASVQEGLQLAESLAAARHAANSLFNLWQTRIAAQQGDYPHDKELTAIDNMVVSHSLLTRGALVLNKALEVSGDFGFAASTLRNGDRQPLRSQRLQIKGEDGLIKTFHRDLGFSDHLPLVVELKRSLSATRSIDAVQFNPDIEQQGGAATRPEVPAALCNDSETRRVTLDMMTATLSQARRGECLQIEAPLTLRKTGLFNIAFDFGDAEQLTARERIVILSADRAFGVNKDWLRNTLQRSEGRTITRVRGRVGVIDGVKALFMSAPERDVEFAKTP